MAALAAHLGLALCLVLAVHSADQSKCKEEDKQNLPGQCGTNVCSEDDGTWMFMSCGLVSIPAKWKYVSEDVTKPYPECCGYAVPPMDIVPDVLDKLQKSDFLQITYEGDQKVDVGNELTPTQVKNQPTISYRADPDSYYLLCMTDPDAPSRENPSSREFLHWLVGNIPGGDVAKGEVLDEYVGSGPPKGTGLHRYVFLLYKQPGKLSFDEPRADKTSVTGRGKFSIQKFAKKYDLGDPVAINVYQAQYDDYVPELHKLLGLTPN